MQTITAPETVPLSKIKAFLADLGIDAKHLINFECGVDGVHVEMYALNEDGHPYFANPSTGEAAVHRISMQLDRDA
jgi:hypothetical protein